TGDQLVGALWSVENEIERAPDALVVDGHLADAAALEALERFCHALPKTDVFYLAAPDDYAGQTEAARIGAVVFGSPADFDDLRTVVLNAGRRERRVAKD